MAKKKKKKKKKKLSMEERAKTRASKKFKVDINTIFNNASFIQIPTRDHHFDLEGRTIELDNIFLYENIIVISEDSESRPEDIRDHLNNKAQVSSYIEARKESFINQLEKVFRRFKRYRKPKYSIDDFRLVFLYCSRNKVQDRYKLRHKNIIFMDFKNLQYFLRLSKAINKTIRFELFRFLKLTFSDIGLPATATDNRDYEGFLLPESPSGYPKGFKIVTFLVEPQTVLEQAYVLRKDGWLDSECLYQRLLMPSKIGKMREYLVSEGRVFVNNVIVSLPDTTRLFGKDGKEVHAADLTRKCEVSLQIPKELNSIGIIDGQHRIFSYHEGLDKYDKNISILREKQHLLLTGIIYPHGTGSHEKAKFEARLFLEINDRQTKTIPALKHGIELLVNPSSKIAISKKILNNLSNDGPLSGYLEEHFFDYGKIKTSSIVSYGLNHLVKLSGDDSLFKAWRGVHKNRLLEKRKSKKVLDKYIDYCTKEIKTFLSAFKKNIDRDMWTLDKKKSRVLTTTTINGLICCLRKLIEDGKKGDFNYYDKAFKKMKINFRPGKFIYKSSHWKDLGKAIYEQCFK